MTKYRMTRDIETLRWDGSNDAAVQAFLPHWVVARDGTFTVDPYMPRLRLTHPEQDNLWLEAGQEIAKAPNGMVTVTDAEELAATGFEPVDE